MSDIGVGKLLTGEAHKDAIHIAVAPMTAAETLKPGQHVGLVSMSRAGTVEHPIGIVDPFLDTIVKPGERFYLFLYPGSIASLRHEWVHPAFVGQAFMQDDVAHKWIEDFAVSFGQTYDSLMEGARMWLQSEEYSYDNSQQYDNSDPRWETFWEHYETLTKVAAPPGTRGFFTCSC